MPTATVRLRQTAAAGQVDRLVQYFARLPQVVEARRQLAGQSQPAAEGLEQHRATIRTALGVEAGDHPLRKLLRTPDWLNRRAGDMLELGRLLAGWPSE
jgi:hypothetical protein